MKIKIARPPEGAWVAYEADAVPAGYEVKDDEDYEFPFKPDSWPAIELAEAILRRSYKTVFYSTDEDALANAGTRSGEAAYRAELKGDVESIVADVESGDIDDQDDLYERMHEVCDSTVTYTSSAYNVLRHTDHFEYGFEEGVIGDKPNNWVTAIAYWAYYGDLQEALGNRLDMNKKHLGRCDECKCKGYVVEDDVVKVCGAYDCDHGEKFATRDDAIKQAVEDEAIKVCRVCDNRSYYVTEKKQIEACPSCAASMEKNDSEKLAGEDGYEPDDVD